MADKFVTTEDEFFVYPNIDRIEVVISSNTLLLKRFLLKSLREPHFSCKLNQGFFIKLILLFISLIPAISSAQVEYKIDCSSLKEEDCFRKKISESNKVNESNKVLLAEALRNCKSFKFNMYQTGEIISHSEVSKVGDKCKLVKVDTKRHVGTTCILDQAERKAMANDIEWRTPELRTLIMKSCKNEVVGNSAEAVEMRKKADSPETKKQIKEAQDHALAGFKKGYEEAKAECKKGNKETCQMLPMLKEKIKENCLFYELVKECEELLR
jgi:hypothetical protein